MARRRKTSPLRKGIEAQPWSSAALGGAGAAWVRLCHATTRWETRGAEAVATALEGGPVVVVLWHEMLTMPGLHWRPEWGAVSALHTTRFAGRVAGVLQGKVGFTPIAMASRASNVGTSREILRRFRAGTSVALTADGPSGPARMPKDAPLEWARATGRPVFTFGFASTRQVRLRTWDRLVWPLPLGRGAAVWRPWRAALPRRMEAAELAALRTDLAGALDATVAEAEAMVGRAPYSQRP
jgi:lysophospholipid acyltransferase (LPLAT)-like uncharacterized protein